MSESNNTIKKTLLVAVSLSIVCSVIVSTAATVLKPTQQYNKDLDRKKNILMAAGLYQDGADIEKLFQRVEVKVVELASGTFAADVDADSYDQRKAAKDPAASRALSKSEDQASINRLEHNAFVYLVRDTAGALQTIVLPIHGYGLWSTLYGFLALKPDANTIVGLGFYDHAETPGLGGEVDNPKWKALWPGKKVYDTEGNVAIRVVKGPGSGEHGIDGLSGATLTARGVSNLVQFWAGESGFGPFLQRVRAGEVR